MKSAFCLSVLFCSLLLLTARPVSAQKTFWFMKATASKQGLIKGATPDNSFNKDYIQLTNVSFNEEAPATADTYRDKGATKHEILKVSKKADNLTAQFLIAFSNHEMFSEVVIELLENNKLGTAVPVMILTLTGHVYMSDFKQNGDTETISYSYEQMKVTEPPEKSHLL